MGRLANMASPICTHYIILCVLSQIISVAHARSCTTHGFNPLPAGVSILNATLFPRSSAQNQYGQSAADDPGYSPSIAWNFPALCAVIASVSEGNSSYKLGLFLPESWSRKFMVIGGYSFSGVCVYILRPK